MILKTQTLFLRTTKTVFALGLSLLLINCGGGGGGEEGGTPPQTPTSPIVKRTTFTLISRTRVAADSFSDLVAKIKVLNEADQPVSKFTMRLLIPNEEGVNHVRCADSDSQGIVVCVLRAHKPGEKIFTISGSDQTIKVEFTREHDGNALMFDTVSGGHALTAAGPDLVSGTAGKRYSVPSQEAGTDLIINDVSVSN